MGILRPSKLLLYLRRILRNDQLVLGLLAVFTGAVAAAAVVLFRVGIDLAQALFFGARGPRLPDVAAGLAWWHVLLAPAVGGLLVGLLIRYTMPGQRPQAVADVIEGSVMKWGRMPLLPGLWAAVISALSIGAGASVGREGPAVHLGATLGGSIATKLHLSRSLSRTLLGCGAASAVAASFNAPIAGALFAHEVVLGHYGLSAFGPIVIASVTGTLISRAYFGDFPAFIKPEYELVSFLEFPAFAGLGLACGLVAVGMMWSIFAVQRGMNRLPMPTWLQPALAGLGVGLIAIFFPQVLGVGYAATDDTLRDLLSFETLVLLLGAKLVATALSLGARFGGGVFSPSITLGALLGGAYGFVATGIFPELSSGPHAYALVGMGALAAAVLGAPLSTTLIIFELTGDYAMTVAVMVAVVVATVVVVQVTRRPSFFHWQLELRGLDLKGGQEVNLLRSLKVRDYMRRDCVTIPPGTPLPEVRLKLQQVPYGELFVVDKGGVLHGTVTLADLSEAAFDSTLDELVNAEDVARRHPPVLEPHDDLGKAMRLMVGLGEEHVAVVESQTSMRLAGCVHESELLLAYNRALLRARAEERGERAPTPF